MNSKGSVIPVIIEVRAADRSKLPTTFFFSGRAVLYIANAAAGRPNIMNGNFPAINLVADTEKTSVDFEASSAKKMLCAPATMLPSIIIEPPSSVCQKGI